MSNTDTAKSHTPAQSLDFAEMGRHLAHHFATELARLEDVKTRVDRQATTDGFKSEFQALDSLGNLTINVKSSTKTILLQKQGGHLDGLQVTIGDITFTYPNNSIQMDTLSLPTYNIPVSLKGTAGDSYLIIQSTIDNWTLSATLK